ncbi:hypothetical protein C5167_015000 [Papaver somniferum]|uniref:Uncharacterized protein n=1 Tax=Papaver somniferum TaxID=3469 RepID=A0A4Y7J5P4_PAPSO|nr:hypothetical protein C5167_015000 [Papaver somniferum]
MMVMVFVAIFHHDWLANPCGGRSMLPFVKKCPDCYYPVVNPCPVVAELIYFDRESEKGSNSFAMQFSKGSDTIHNLLVNPNPNCFIDLLTAAKREFSTRDRPEGNFVRKWSKSVEWEVTNEHGSAPIIVIITATFVKEVQGAQKERGYGHTDAMTYALLEVYYTSLSLTYMECFNGRLNLRYLQKNLLQQ